MVYGYLLPFAENKKTDLGGAFYVKSLQQLYVGNVIYVVLMTGVLFYRAKTGIPAFIAGSSIIYVIYSGNRFRNEFNWETLPLRDVMKLEQEADAKKRLARGTYRQPELNDE